jgi:hypothetical protein
VIATETIILDALHPIMAAGIILQAVIDPLENIPRPWDCFLNAQEPCFEDL